MTPIFNGPQLAYLIVALIVLGLAFAGIVWVGRIVRGELGSDASRNGDPAALAASTMFEQLPPALMKEAIASGLIVPSQLAAMTNAERTFLFASLKQKVASGEAAPVAPAKQPGPTLPGEVVGALPANHPTDLPSALSADLPARMRAILGEEKLRVWCPMCGAELQLPAFPPLVARCKGCGMRTAIRSDEGGRFTINVAPPPKGG